MKLFRLCFFFFLAFGLSLSAFSAAPPPPPSGGGIGTPACWPPPCVPIDGGIVFLMAAGAAYGAKKFRDTQKSRKTSL
jgi:hypothetical protein